MECLQRSDSSAQIAQDVDFLLMVRVSWGTIEMRASVRCPECPRTVPEEEYREHWERFHAVCFYTGKRNAYREPLKCDPVRPRRASERDDDAPLWEDDG